MVTLRSFVCVCAQNHPLPELKKQTKQNLRFLTSELFITVLEKNFNTMNRCEFWEP